jgi:tRNA threonylcarbamoyl adenosine modification protein (Sua5/YciO/YrdC/YwlC family)
VYGFGSRPNDETAIGLLRQLKARAMPNPFTLHLDHLDSVKKFSQSLSVEQQQWIKNWLPGAYTIILTASDNAPPDAILKGNVGLRVPNSTDYSQFVAKFGPVLGTSVNERGEPPLHNVEEILNRFGDQISLLVQAEKPFRQEASVVIDLTRNPFKALRGTLPNDLVS